MKHILSYIELLVTMCISVHYIYIHDLYRIAIAVLMADFIMLSLKDGWDSSIGDKDGVQIPSRRLPTILNLH